MSSRLSAHEFYVYTLTDPRNNQVFYVGKGTKNRMHHHVGEAKRGVYSRKCTRIRSILDAGHEVVATAIAYFVDEAEAYDFERVMIEQFGLSRLTNVCPGGQLTSTQHIERRESRRRERLHKSLEKKKSFLREWLFRVDQWTSGVTFPGIKDGDRLAEEFVAGVRRLVSSSSSLT